MKAPSKAQLFSQYKAIRRYYRNECFFGKAGKQYTLKRLALMYGVSVAALTAHMTK